MTKNFRHNTPSDFRKTPARFFSSRKVTRLVKSLIRIRSLTNHAARHFERPQGYYGLVFLLLIFSIFLLASPALAIEPLVHCGGTGQPLCTTCDFLVLGKNISDFILVYLVPAISALFFIYAGFEILLGGGIQSRVARGRAVFQTTAYGLLIIFLAWLIVNTVLRTVASDENIAENWWKLECRETIIKTTVSPTPPVVSPSKVPSNEDLTKGQSLARDLLNLGIIFSASGDCGPSFQARQNIQDIANGKFPAVCSSTCKTKTPACVVGGPNGNTSVNWRILEGLKGLYQLLKQKYGTGFIVTSLTTGVHSPNSPHYIGEAADIVVNSGDTSIWREARFYLNDFGGGAAICERKSDAQDESNCSLDFINHIHWTLRR